MNETTQDTDTRYYCASCVRGLVEEGIAQESDAALLIPAPVGHTCDWCMLCPATLMEPDEQAEEGA